MFNEMKNEKGFTLIELLIVIAILGILAVTIIPNFVGFDYDAKIKATKSNLEALRGSIKLYRAKKGLYPDELQKLVTETFNDAGAQVSFLDKIPVEQISSTPSNAVENDSTITNLTGDPGGWYYDSATKRVYVNLTTALEAATWETSDSPAAW